MPPLPEQFTFDYFGTDIVYGRGRVGALGDQCETHGFENALLVCGTNVGANDALMGPIEAALGDRLAGVFDETTPQKLAETVYDGIDVMHELNVDVVIGVGGGSSLNVARQMTVFDADGRSLDTFREQARDGAVDSPDPDRTDRDPVPVIVVPTTFAGADLSGVGSVELLSAEDSPTGQPVRTMGSNMPVATVHDPDLFETTPVEPLAGSAMNGFNKGLETIYSRSTTPITDATAVYGLQLLTESYPRLVAADGIREDAEAMNAAVVGNVLVQFRRTTSLIHAFGHAFARRYRLQQGLAHAVVAPHALAYLLDRVDARRTLLARGLGIDPTAHSEAELAREIVDTVEDVRDSLGLPVRLRDLGPVARSDITALAEYTLQDSPTERAPSGLDPTVEELTAVLESAW